MTRLPIRLLFLIAAIVWQGTTVAQEELLDESQPDIKYYTVEVIVFAYAEDVSVGTEVFLPDPEETPRDDVDSFDEVRVKPKLRRHPDAVGLVPVMLSEEQFTMSNIERRLQLLDAYDPILHAGWTQAGFPLSDTSAVPLETLPVQRDGLSGTFTLYLERYLHLVVDLALAAPQAAAASPPQPAFVYGNSRQAFDSIDPAAPRAVHFRIREDRIVKNGEIRYYDHPRFGVIAKVTRVEDAADATLRTETRR